MIKIIGIVIVSWATLILTQNIITIDNVRRMNTCIKEQKAHYTKCIPTTRFYNYLQYNQGECIAYKLFPAGLDIKEDRQLVEITCGRALFNKENEWGY